MVHSDFITMHRKKSANVSLSQTLCMQVFVRAMRVATLKTSIGRCRPMHNDGSLIAPIFHIGIVIEIEGKTIRCS